MNLYRSQFRRLAELDREIRSCRYPNCFSFAKKWEVSRRTIARDIEFLKEKGAPLDYDGKRNGYYYTDRSWQMPMLDLTEGELLQLILAERMAAQYKGTPLAKTLASLFEKICAALPDNVSIDPVYLGEQFSFYELPSRPIAEEVWLSVFRSVRENRVLWISYMRPDWEKPGIREIEPIHLACVGGEWYIVAHCRRRNSLRHFAISRIIAAEPVDEHFEPHDFDPEEYFSNRFARFVGQDGKPHKIAVRFTAEAAPWVLEREWHPQQKVKRHRDGGITLSFPAPELYEVRRWILQWGADAEVLKPKELRDDVAREARATARRYAGKQ